MHMLIQANHALLEQAATLVYGLDDTEYRQTMQGYGSGSIGEHLRHILDHYHALLMCHEGVINYDHRRRDNPIASDKNLALVEIKRILSLLPSLSEQAVRVRAEVSPHALHVEEVGSTMRRELLFVTSHAVHHFVLIAILLRLQGMSVPPDFGVAPATLTYQRQQCMSA